MFDLSKPRKKKKKKKDKAVAEDAGAAGEAGDSAAPSAGEAAYTYDDLLDRALDMVAANNPEHAERRQFKMKPPTLMKVGSKKTLWTNYREICELMARNPDHVFSFFLAELGTEGSIDARQRLMLRGKFVPKYIESLLRKYMNEYVMCSMCRSPKTTLTKDQVSRLYFMHCSACGSSRSVAPIRSGYHAATRADRRAARK